MLNEARALFEGVKELLVISQGHLQLMSIEYRIRALDGKPKPDVELASVRDGCVPFFCVCFALRSAPIPALMKFCR
jgi:hypothetical protein